MTHEVDTVGYSMIDSTLFVARKNTSAIELSKDSKVTLSMDLMGSLPKFLGNTDPIQVLKYMPGVQTVNEFDSGINVQGCDDSHNEISIGGVPVYGAAHMFGFFSVFNPSHFNKFDLEKSLMDASGPNRIGASIDMKSRRFEKEKVTGEVNIGIMSSQGTLSWRVSPKVQMHFSARQSYMNLLYKRWMKLDNFPVRYGFGDYNFSLFYRPSSRDDLYLEAYYGHDRMKVTDDKFGMTNLSLDWGNYLVAMHWDHRFADSKLEQTLYTSSNGLNGHLIQDVNDLKMPSYMRTYGYKAHWTDESFYAGGEVLWHETLPQAPVRLDEGIDLAAEPEHQNGLETDAYFGYRQEYGNGIGFSAGGKAMYYLDPERKSHGAFSPSASFWYDTYTYGRVTFSYAWQHQYLFKTGLPNIGLPLDFWFMAGKHSAPQQSHSFSLAYNAVFLDGMLALDVSTYFKRLRNQVEYRGTFLDFFTMQYDLDKFLRRGHGMNYGFNLMLHKVTGPVTGWISYSFGRSLRNFEDEGYKKYYPSNHERIHEFNAVVDWKIKRWDLSASFVCASGLPFTPPKDFYITSDHLVTSFGEYNSRRIKPYVRLDLSVNFTILKKKGHDFGMNISMFNVLGNQNPVGYQLCIDEDGFYYGPMSFTLRFIPSFSLYYKF